MKYCKNTWNVSVVSTEDDWESKRLDDFYDL